MSTVIHNSNTYSVHREAPTFRDRVPHLVYGFILLLGFTTLYAMAETRALESRTVHYLPAEDLHNALTQNQLPSLNQ